MRRSSDKVVAVFSLLMVAGCSSDGPRTVDNPDPNRKIPAIVKAVNKRDTKVIPVLLADLDSEDSAVRFYADRALRDLTGQDFGFRYYEDQERRKPAVDRWRDWLARHPVSSPAQGR